MFNFELGDKAKDSVTGFQGIITSRTEYLNGCIQYGIEASKLSDNGKTVTQWFDEDRLARTGPGVNKAKKSTPAKRPGGPGRTLPSPCQGPS